MNRNIVVSTARSPTYPYIISFLLWFNWFRFLVNGFHTESFFWSELWGQTAEYVSKYVDKGARVGVVGTLQIDEWSDSETGEKRNKPKVIVREFDILETKAESDLRRQNSRGSSYYVADDDVYDPSGGSSGGFFD